MTQTSRYNALMDELCVGLGWGGGTVNGQPSHVDFFIPEAGPVTAEQFLDWLLEAEGFTALSHPQDHRQWRAQLLPVFIRKMGADTVDATELKWNAP
ncbi:hypothetical protein [Brevundimonas sp. M20]|uniref:hypothetical protein n=1 Tax=Brevundimonas sp. M20 TaxID=2591463 RepID=UPI0011479785|nr:hypothetical protein [Brevundimonas sp. M20]QDH72540.1 hypothetical protein FKQ52_03285 [Brevundimonas sp. M20]